MLGTPVELVSLRAIGIGATVRATLGTDASGEGRSVDKGGEGGEAWAVTAAGPQPAPPVGRGPCASSADEHPSEVAVHGGPDLRPGHALDGPALVDGSDTTIWVPPGCSALVDGLGTLVMEVR